MLYAMLRGTSRVACCVVYGCVQHLDTEQRSVCIDALEEHLVPKGANIITQGSFAITRTHSAAALSRSVQRRLHGCTAAALGSKALPVPMPRCAARLYVALNVRVVAWHVTRRVARCVLCATLGETGDYFYLLESGTADCFVCAVRCRAQSHPLI
jgi:hypothetical protein